MLQAKRNNGEAKDVSRCPAPVEWNVAAPTNSARLEPDARPETTFAMSS